jgi:hypothetical protein
LEWLEIRRRGRERKSALQADGHFAECTDGVRDDWFQSYTRGAPPQSSPGNLIQPSGHLGFIQFGPRPRPKRARGYFPMIAHTHLMTPPLIFNDPEREVFNHKPSF